MGVTNGGRQRRSGNGLAGASPGSSITGSNAKPGFVIDIRKIRPIANANRKGSVVSNNHSIKFYLSAVLVHIYLISGCTLPRNPVPVAQIPDAELVGISGVRAFAGEVSPVFQQDLIESVRQERPGDFPLKPDGSTSYSALALSGGGANGAFGAGFLSGWTEAGTRPEFKLVTGISTGALIAPFAFLGPEYDEILRRDYTTITTRKIFVPRNFVSLLWNESLEDTAPLANFIESEMNEQVMQAIAEEHNHGRRLYVGTTNLDAQRLVIWNMGAIAASGHPGSLKLFHKVLLASASIPGAFPPVYFKVEVDGKLYDEMHVDGGTITEVFFYGLVVDLPAARKESFGQKTPKAGGAIYIIRNGKVGATPEQVRRSLPSIVRRAITTLTRAHGMEDLYRIYVITEQDQIDFNYVGIPQDYVSESTEPFDPAEMTRLFDLGFEMGKSGDKWHKAPPGLDIAE